MPAAARIAALAALAAVVVALVPAGQAWACSCAEPTVEQLLEFEPDTAVARVERIDTDGGSSGVGLVEEVLHGPRLPEQVPLALDDGASCLPWVAVGDVAVLAFVPDGDGWRTLECGLLDPTTGLDPVTADPDASGPPSVVLSGRFPGADLLALDDHLRVLATGSLTYPGHGLRVCGDGLLLQTPGPDGGVSVVLVGLPGLEVVEERSLSTGPEADLQVVDTSCEDGRVDVLTVSWGVTREARAHRDVFGEDRLVALPAVEDAAFAGDGVLLLPAAEDGAGLRVELHDLSDGRTRELLSLDGARGYELTVAPDGRHALVRGFAEDSLLVVLDLATGEVGARSAGSWQPVHRPWLGAERILQVDEDAGGVGGTGLASYRIVDLDLAPVATLDPVPGWNAAGGAGGRGRPRARRDPVPGAPGATTRSAEHPWAAGASEAVLLGAVATGTEAAAADLPEVHPTTGGTTPAEHASAVGGTPGTSLGPEVGTVAAALASVALAAFVVRRRRRRR